MFFLVVGIDVNDTSFSGEVTYQKHCVILVYLFVYSSKM